MRESGWYWVRYKHFEWFPLQWRSDYGTWSGQWTEGELTIGPRIPEPTAPPTSPGPSGQDRR